MTLYRSLDLYILSKAQASDGHLTYFNNDKGQEKIKVNKRHKKKAHGNIKILILELCYTEFVKSTALSSYILVFLFKEKGETSTSYRNKNAK